MKFSCVPGCSDCCIYREYYPSKEFGKIGVLLLPEEKNRMERLANERNIAVKILPRLAVGNGGPERIIAYQMMGKKDNGDFCPFLDENIRSPHGGLACSVYDDRPLACSAYPLIDAGKTAALDPHCQFCRHNSPKVSLAGLSGELESLAKIKASVKAEEGQHVWRYATATGDGDMMPEGWVLES